jgi:hypothetical protein
LHGVQFAVFPKGQRSLGNTDYNRNSRCGNHVFGDDVCDEK